MLYHYSKADFVKRRNPGNFNTAEKAGAGYDCRFNNSDKLPFPCNNIFLNEECTIPSWYYQPL